MFAICCSCLLLEPRAGLGGTLLWKEKEGELSEGGEAGPMKLTGTYRCKASEIWVKHCYEDDICVP